MEIKVCKNSGFCYGVKRADDMVKKLLNQGEKVCVLGPLVHNKSYVAELEAQGARTISGIDEAQPDEILVIRSHGVPAQTYQILEEKAIKYCDATCPSVKKIQDLVKKLPADARLLIAGDPGHAEVIGILGSCPCRADTFRTEAELVEILQNSPEPQEKELYCLAQTTFSVALWESAKEKIKKYCTNARLFDTICETTRQRQAEAEEMASVCDLMIVIGGKDSSNTKKLFSVCEARTKSIHIQSASELDAHSLEGYRRVGITAGASTPVKNIMEVVQKMNENKELIPETEDVKVETAAAEEELTVDMADVPDNGINDGEEFDFERALEESFQRLNKSDTVKGIVTAVYPSEVQVDIGRKHAGYIPLDELTNDPNAKAADLVKVGDELTLMVMKTNDVDGTVMMSKRRVDASANWLKVVEAKETGEVLEGYVVENVGGGVIVSHEGVRVFIPASHTGIPREGNLDDLLKTTVKFIIIDIEERGRRKKAVGSIKRAGSNERRQASEKFWETAKVGDVMKGVVRSITAFGAFVTVEGTDGLLHRTELSWRRFKNIEDVVSIGQEITVMIKDLNPEKKRISLTCRMPEDDPFKDFVNDYHVGDAVDATITSIVPYGAFAEIVPGVEGLVHISNVSHRKIAKVSDELAKGQTVRVKITEINPETRKIGLSIKALLSDEDLLPQPKEDTAEPAEAPVVETTEETPAVETAEETPAVETAEETSAADIPETTETE